MNDFVSIFVGVPQSRYAALAILLAIVVVALVILFGKDSIPISQKFGFIFLVFLVSLPGLALSLFQLTCMVTGSGANNKRWWCNIYAWVISAIMIFYAVLLVVAAVTSINAPSPATPVVKSKEQFSDMMAMANDMAAQLSSGTYPNSQNPMKTAPAQLYAPNPQSPPVVERFTETPVDSPVKSPDNFVVYGESSIPAPFPGNGKVTLDYAPGAQLNGNELPMPSSPAIESFYAPAEFKK